MSVFRLAALIATSALTQTPSGWSRRECTSCYPNNAVIRSLVGETTLAACQAACQAEPRCAYVNIALPPGNQACWLFATCGSPEVKPGCGGGWWTTYTLQGRASARLWPPTAAGFTGKIKAMWFGANVTGLDTDETLALMAKHTVAGYGWETGGDTSTSAAVGWGEAFGSAAVVHARDYMDSHNNSNGTVLFQYRQIQVALRLYSQSAIAAADPRNSGFWLKDSTTGRVCATPSPWGTDDPFWDFRNESAVDYWIDHVVGQVAADPAMAGRPSAVFFDEADQGDCGDRVTSCDLSKLNHTATQHASIHAMFPRMVAALNDAGIVPMFSLMNRFTAAADRILDAPVPCALPEDDVAAALKGLAWVRFYENWPGSFWLNNTVVSASPDIDAMFIANAILEAEAGIPTALHVDAGGAGAACPAKARSISRPGPLGGPIEFWIASYLVVAGAGSTLSISNNWFDADFCWRSELDVEYGTPLGPAVRTATHTWARNFTRCSVTIDVSVVRQGRVHLLP